jgi:hypothetical protein
MPLRLTEAQYARLKAGKPIGRTNKFNARGDVVDGIAFQSTFEANHYRELKLRLLAGDIRNLRWQVRYPLVANNVTVAAYVADFQYEERDGDGWRTVIVDTKSEPTRRQRLYRLKKKLMFAMGFEIREVVKPSRSRHATRRRV